MASEGMESEEPGPLTTDEQLGSPAWSFEKGWLVGVGVGLAAVVLLTHRRARPRTGEMATG